MEKNYQIKVYQYDGTYKTTISPSLILSKISFENQINGGQGQFTLRLQVGIDDTTFSMSDMLKITCFDDNNIDGRLIYTGFISRIERRLNAGGEYIELICLGLYSFLNRLFFNSGATYIFNKNQDTGLTIGNIVDYFNSIYTANRFSKTDVELYGSNVSIDFSYRKCIDALKDIQAITRNFYFYIGPDGKVRYKERLVNETNHRLKVENQVEEILINEQVETVKNKLFVSYGSSIGGPYEDATSQTQYGMIEHIVSPSGIADSGGADLYGAEYIAENKDETKQITVTVNNKYDLESIEPGHTVTLLNIDYEIATLEIQKVKYYFDRAILYLNKYETFAETVLSNNE